MGKKMKCSICGDLNPETGEDTPGESSELKWLIIAVIWVTFWVIFWSLFRVQYVSRGVEFDWV